MSRCIMRGPHKEMIRSMIMAPTEKPSIGVTMLDDYDDLGRSMDLRVLLERNPVSRHSVRKSNALTPQNGQEKECDGREMTSVRRTTADSVQDSNIVTESSWGKCDIGEIAENTPKVEKKMQSQLHRIQRPRESITSLLGALSEAPHELFQNSPNSGRHSSWGSQDSQDIDELTMEQSISILSPQHAQEKDHNGQEMSSVRGTTAGSAQDSSIATESSWGKCDIGDIAENVQKVEKKMHLQRIQRPRESITSLLGALSFVSDESFSFQNSPNPGRHSSWGSQDSQDIDELAMQQSISILSPQHGQEKDHNGQDMSSVRRNTADSAQDRSIVTESSWGKCDIGEIMDSTVRVEKKMQSHLQCIQRPRKKITSLLGELSEAPNDSFNNSQDPFRRSSWGSVDIEELIERGLTVEMHLEKTLTHLGKAT